MAEVVQDLFDHVTYAGGSGRRRVDAVRGFSAGTPKPGVHDYAVVKEDPQNPRGPQLRCMQELMFHEMLDKPFEEKGYRAQLEEFAYRGERIVRQIDMRFGQLHHMMEHDVLRRSAGLLRLMRQMDDALHQAHGLINHELEEVWHLRFEPFFYPTAVCGGAAGSAEEDGTPPPDDDDPALPQFLPGGWIDRGDVILTTRLLIRYIAEMVSLVSMAVQQLPEDVLSDRATLRGRPPHPALRAIVAALVARVPWIGASLPVDKECLSAGQAPLSTAASPMNDAIAALDEVLAVHMKNLRCDLHRTMYQAFVKMVAAYVRWKRTFAVERKRALRKDLQEQAEAAAVRRSTHRRQSQHAKARMRLQRRPTTQLTELGMSALDSAPGSDGSVRSPQSDMCTPGAAAQGLLRATRKEAAVDEMD